MASYQKTAPGVWSGRIDGTDLDLLRWHQIIELSEPAILPDLEKGQQGIAFIGFCCDEGVRRNNGRVGAGDGPQTIRNYCGNFPVVADHIRLIDAGDVYCKDGDLGKAQTLLADKLAEIVNAGYLPIVLGGGQELSYGTFQSLKPKQEGLEYGIINFDAHFDLRAIKPEEPAHSGSWVWQVQNDCKNAGIPFHYLALGIQQYSNTRRLFELAIEMGAPYFLAEHFTSDQLENILKTINGIIANSDVLHLAIDMDVFAAPYAPGVSAAGYNGISPNAMFKRLLRHVVLSGKVAAIDIAEVNPSLDTDNRTSRLAAAFIFDIVQAADINAEYPTP